MSIKSWPVSERPREKMLQGGVSILSDAELLAVLLRSGNHGKDVLTLARDLLSEAGGIRGLFNLESHRLSAVKGLGPAKVAALLAVMEIARRCLKENVLGRSYVKEPQAVLDYLSFELRDQKKEFFKVLFLDKANCILDSKTLFAGTVDQTAVHPREIVAEAIGRHATALVLVHNHPSGRVEPSHEDRQLTAKLASVCGELSIKVLDHLIIGDNRFFSFREHGLL